MDHGNGDALRRIVGVDSLSGTHASQAPRCLVFYISLPTKWDSHVLMHNFSFIIFREKTRWDMFLFTFYKVRKITWRREVEDEWNRPTQKRFFSLVGLQSSTNFLILFEVLSSLERFNEYASSETLFLVSAPACCLLDFFLAFWLLALPTTSQKQTFLCTTLFFSSFSLFS